MSDTATIISICPFPIEETKPGLVPNSFRIPAAALNDIEILNITNNVYCRQRVPVVGNILEIPILASTLAESIVNDRLTGQLLYSTTSKPGLFWVPGTYNKAEAKIKFAKEIKEVTEYQNNWYIDLTKLADDDWNKYHQHKFITDMQRHAGRVLGLERDWLVEAAVASEKKCIACYSSMHVNAAICPTCRTNQEEFAKVKK